MIKEYMASLALPISAVTVNDGNYLEHEIIGYRTKQVLGRDSLEVNISEVSIGKSDGARYRDKKDMIRTIQVSFDLVADTVNEWNLLRDKLTAVLYQENSKWVFADEPNVYYNGTVDQIAYSKINTSNNDIWAKTGMFTIRCSDPYKYSQTLKTATNDEEDTITITNNGSKEVVLEEAVIEMIDNSGFVALTSNDRYFQIGNAEEGDAEYAKRSKLLFTDEMYNDQGWILNQGYTPPVTSIRRQEGILQYTDLGEGKGYVMSTGYGQDNPNEQYNWHGPSLTKIVPPNEDGEYPKNWTATWKYDFNPDGSPNRNGHVGHQSVSFIDSNDEIIFSVVIEDTTATVARSGFSFYVGKSNNKAYANHGDGESMYTTGSTITVDKIGSTIIVRMECNNFTYTFQAADYSTELRKITWYAAKLDSRNQMRWNVLRSMTIRQHYGTSFSELPNYFQPNDVVKITNKNEVFINDTPHFDLVDIGSQPILLKPGINTIGVATSSFSETPKVEITFRERWL